MEELRRLQEVNAQQAQDLAETRAQIAALQEELARIQELDRTLRAELHIENAPQSALPPASTSAAVQSAAPAARAGAAPAIQAGAAAQVQAGAASAVQAGGVPGAGAVPAASVESGTATSLRAPSAGFAVTEAAASVPLAPGAAAPGGGALLSAALKQQAAALVQQAERQLASLQQIQNAAAQYIRAAAHFPDAWPLAGAITSTFGYRRSPLGWGREFHEGIDLAAPYGAPIRAAAAGVVVHAGWLPGFGRAVKIDHGNGLVTLYGHQSRIKVKVGQSVKKGQVIGYVGSSGLSTGPHLHFGVYRNGVPVDPLPYLTSDLYQYLKK
ncbi:MAG: peptidoglycan DD-metalloendopeptidase family protein [Firmicutes bacterium]|nr:peptidoglycan DD-metalloendopeptidase family protein [Bacillota bacterium]